MSFSSLWIYKYTAHIIIIWDEVEKKKKVKKRGIPQYYIRMGTYPTVRRTTKEMRHSVSHIMPNQIGYLCIFFSLSLALFPSLTGWHMFAIIECQCYLANNELWLQMIIIMNFFQDVVRSAMQMYRIYQNRTKPYCRVWCICLNFVNQMHFARDVRAYITCAFVCGTASNALYILLLHTSAYGLCRHFGILNIARKKRVRKLSSMVNRVCRWHRASKMCVVRKRKMEKISVRALRQWTKI